MPGVGNGVLYTRLGEWPEWGKLSHKPVAAACALALFNRHSAKSRGKRRIRGGRSNVRTMRYMATVSAIRCNPILRQFYQRLVATGKHEKVAITACMRKFIVILNAMVRDETMWNQQTSNITDRRPQSLA